MMLQRITWARLPVCGPMTVFWGMPNGQRDSASFLVVAGGQHPDVNHVRRDDRALRNVDVKWHSDIVEAIESGDAEKAAATVRDHMAGAATVLVDGAA